ncbi:MAG: N-6 DNA methylase [Thermoanaerobaculia bacterium]
MLFIAFAEDRGLLPSETLLKAYKHHNPYNPTSKWETFQGLFRAIDQGNGDLNIPGYNGGLFARDPGLDRIAVPDEVCAELKRLGDYDYHSPTATNVASAGIRLVDVEILGHIFEQSITDLERMEQELAAGTFELGRVERRHREGAFYTPRVITRFIVARALNPVLAGRFEDLRGQQHARAAKNSAGVLDDPKVYDVGSLKKPQREALILFWASWLGALEKVRVLDPACGSGAFLIEAFDQLHVQYQEAADHLYELRGFRTLFDPDQTILEKNLYGVDLNEEAIQICRLSIWIKTAQRGKKLTDLDRTLRAGNSLVDDPELDPRHALDWQAAFPEAFADGGFDVVVGNPPYVRQELLSSLKPYLERRFKAYHGMADLYVYFFERGLGLLKPGGRLSFVVTNKWLRAGYAEPLRRLLSSESWLETLVDLGHAKKIFEDADVFPSIVVLAKPQPDVAAPIPRAAVISRDDIRLDDLDQQVMDAEFDLSEALGSAPWTPEPEAVQALMTKIRTQGIPLVEYAGVKPYYGIKTGLNEAFLVDTATRNRLVAEDTASAEILKPYLRGQDVRRWQAEWDGQWMIFARRGIEIERYPAILRHLEQYREGLEPKPPEWSGDRWPGRKGGNYAWYEIQDSVDYWPMFEKPKIVYQDIAWESEFALDEGGLYCNNTTYFIPVGTPWILAVLNSPVLWWYLWRTATHAKDEALRFFSPVAEALPIASPHGSHEGLAESMTRGLISEAAERTGVYSVLIDWLKVEHEVIRPTLRISDFPILSQEDFIEAVRHARGKKKPLSAAALRSLREEHARTIAPLAERLREAGQIEMELSDLVCQAYNLTADEIALMWQTAPPRMPIPAPECARI